MSTQVMTAAETALAPIDDGIDVIIAQADPNAIIARASKQAEALKGVIDKKKLYVYIGGKKHVLVEGWTTLGILNGLLPFTESVDVVRDGDILSARALVSARRSSDGIAVAQAEGFCSTREAKWRGRDEYAVRSMAQTRATSKVFRQAFAWVMVLAGFEPTPAEEVGDAGSPAAGRTANRRASVVGPESAASKRPEPEPAKKQPPATALSVAEPIPAVSAEEGQRIQTAYGTVGDDRRDAVLAFFKTQGYATWSDFFKRGGASVRHVKDLLGLSEIPM